jgi:hydrogenase nickel incorporation protein HypB
VALHLESGDRLHHLEQEVLAKNSRSAEQNRALLRSRHVFALNLVSSPGAGKTTLLEKTIRALGTDHPLSVIEGDQETALDADRIRAAGAPVIHVNTGTGCHLDADMIARSIARLSPAHVRATTSRPSRTRTSSAPARCSF